MLLYRVTFSKRETTEMRHHTLLGGLSPREFLERHWHKTPMLARQAIPGFLGLLTVSEIKRLATRPDVQSRLVRRQGKRWELRHGPFRPIDFKTLPDKNWTLLVQEVNHWLPEGEALLQQFDFIPHARLDDLMVSYAAPGGGVGPHFDSYDVFLLQGYGERCWEIAQSDDQELLPDSDLKLLRRFTPQERWDLEAGDMLYLPPHWAHNGVAITECLTYSIGFRAPTYQEWVEAFLDHLRDTLQVEGRYADPDLRLRRHPGEIPPDLIRQIQRMLRRELRWTGREVVECVGKSLSEPKPHLYFEAPDEDLSPDGFAVLACRRGLRLDPRSRLLLAGDQVYCNGERLPGTAMPRRAWRELADERQLAPERVQAAMLPLLFPLWQAGWIKFL